MQNNIYQYKIKDIEGNLVHFEIYKEKVLLIVNVASHCGFTFQYEGLQKIYQQYKNSGLEILGFPCNQFRGQEPGSEKEIAGFCQSKFSISFPLFSKIEVNGPLAHPLYQYLKSKAPGIFGSQFIKWNFTKFLIDRQGNVIKRFSPTDKPESLTKNIEKLL